MGTEEPFYSKIRSFLMLFCLSFFSIIYAFNNTSATFYNYTPPFICEGFINEDPCNISVGNFSSKYDTTAVTSDTYSNNNSTCENGFKFYGPYNETTVITEWQLVCDKRISAAMAVSYYFVSVAIGALVSGALADRYGRKKVLYICVYIQGAIGAIAAFSTSFFTFATLRIVQGLFVQGSVNPSYTLANELFPNLNRTITNGTVEIFWPIGLIILAILAYLLPNWRDLQIVMSILPLTVVTFSLWIIPESPSWIQSRYTQRLKIVKPPVLFDNDSMGKQIINGENENNVKIINGGKSNTEENVEFMDNKFNNDNDTSILGKLKNLICIQTFRNRFLSLVYLWITEMVSYYGITLSIPNLAGNQYINFIIGAVMEILFFIIMGTVIYKFGRRKPLCCNYFINGTSYITVAMLMLSGTSKVADTIRTCVVIFGKGCAIANHMCLLLFVMELFPTQLRSMALGILIFSAQAGTFFAPIINLTANYFWKGMPFIIFSLINYLACFISFMCLPETKNLALPTTIEEAIQV